VNRILVPTEFTYLSKCALNLGLELAKLANAKIDIVSVVQPLYNGFMEKDEEYSYDATSSIKNIQNSEEARGRMLERAEEIAKMFPDQNIAPKILYGNKVDSLINEIEEKKTDLVIVGGDLYDTKDKQVGEFLRKSTSPVITLKCMISGLDGFKDIILLSDTEKDSAQLIIRLKELQELLDAKLHVLRVNTPKNFLSPKKCDATLEQYASFHGLVNFNLVSLDAPTEMEGLLSYCETIQNAFVGLGLHQRSFLRKLLSNEGNPEEFIANSMHPVWTYRG